MNPIMLSIRPANSSNSENNKRNSLLQAIHRKGATSRLQLARELRISNSRVCDLIERMVEEKLLQEQPGLIPALVTETKSLRHAAE